VSRSRDSFIRRIGRRPWNVFLPGMSPCREQFKPFLGLMAPSLQGDLSKRQDPDAPPFRRNTQLLSRSALRQPHVSGRGGDYPA
jgi:hypothetical protein